MKRARSIKEEVSARQQEQAALNLALQIREASDERDAARINFDAFPGSAWRVAVNMLLAGGEVEAARRALEVMVRRKPGDQAMQTLYRILQNVPAADPLSTFKDAPRIEVQVARCPGARNVLFVFSDYQHYVGLPFALAHRWFGTVPAHIVYLRDFSRRWFMSGITSLAPTRDATLEKLQALVRSLSADRIVCFSNSSGGFAAVAYALALGVERVACMAGAFDLSAIKVSRAEKMLLAATGYDLRAAFFAAKHPPEVRIFLGASNWDDRLHADYLSGLPGVTVLPIEGFAGHTIGIEMMARGRFGEIVDWLVSPSGAEPSIK